MAAGRPPLSAAESAAGKATALLLGVLFLGFLGGALGSGAPTAAAAVSCEDFSSPVLDELNPQTGAQLLTTKATEAKKLTVSGFTGTRGAPISAATTSGSGLVPVHRLYRAATRDFFYSADATEIARITASVTGYRDQGVAFYASKKRAACLIGVYSFYRAGIHRFSTTPGERAFLRDKGWKVEGVRFYAGRPKADTTFTLGVMPDTQQETLRADDPRFLNRSEWLIDALPSLDLRFVTLTGDVVNWDSPQHEQYKRAQAALAPLKTAGIPYSISPGNHDTDAVCEAHGGSACDPPRTHIRVRSTPSFNLYLADGTADVRGRFEPKKVDNTYSTFDAGGAQWLVLNLELWPRREVITWARGVVADHAHDNVIVVTHSYLTATGGIYPRPEYGDSSPQYLYDHLIKVYPNIRMVLSGHTGKQATRTDIGTNGNKILSLMLTMHDNVTNPMRFIEVNVPANTVDTWVYAPFTRQSYPAYSTHADGMGWIR